MYLHLTDPFCHDNDIWDRIGYNSSSTRDISRIFASNEGNRGDAPSYIWLRHFLLKAEFLKYLYKFCIYFTHLLQGLS